MGLCSYLQDEPRAGEYGLSSREDRPISTCPVSRSCPLKSNWIDSTSCWPVRVWTKRLEAKLRKAARGLTSDMRMIPASPQDTGIPARNGYSSDCEPFSTTAIQADHSLRSTQGIRTRRIPEIDLVIGDRACLVRYRGQAIGANRLSTTESGTTSDRYGSIGAIVMKYRSVRSEAAIHGLMADLRANRVAHALERMHDWIRLSVQRTANGRAAALSSGSRDARRQAPQP